MANDMQPATSEPQTLESGLRSIVRLVCMGAGMVVFCIGIYFGWHVFKHVESIVTEGMPLETAVDRMADIIGADNITINNPEKNIQLEMGRSVAVGLLWLFYGLWTWIAMGFIKAGGWLIAKSVSAGGS